MAHIHEISNNNERKTLVVIIFTIIAMIAEIGYGYFTNSMALLADGYHMGTHALALGLTYAAYVLIKKYKTEKIGTLAGYTSSLFLGFTGIWIIIEAVQRFLNPLEIRFEEAILVAVVGLIVNAICIFIMEGKGHNHNHHNHTHHEHEENECKQENDYNFKAAYLHILADALTSILAIGALLAGKYFNLIYFDSIIGVLGGILIIKWAIGLLKDTVKVLIDYNAPNLSSSIT